MGLGGGTSGTFVIAPSAKGYVISGATREYRAGRAGAAPKPVKPRSISTDKVEALARAALAPPLAKDQVLSQLVDASWLNAHADAALKQVTRSSVPPCSPAAKDLFIRAFEDRGAALASIKQSYDTSLTDDYPRAKVVITFTDGRQVTLISNEQHALMLPWSRNHESTWNPAFPEALRDLLPEGAPLREDLVRDSLYGPVAPAAMERVRTKFDDLEQRCAKASLIASLPAGFSVTQAYFA